MSLSVWDAACLCLSSLALMALRYSSHLCYHQHSLLLTSLLLTSLLLTSLLLTMLRLGLLVTVALLAAAAGVTPSVAALQLAEDGNLDAASEPGKATALHELLFGVMTLEKKQSKSMPKCNFPFMHGKFGCRFPCFDNNRLSPARCYNVKGAPCPADMRKVGNNCSPKSRNCMSTDTYGANQGCSPYCMTNDARKNMSCKKKTRVESCPANFEEGKFAMWCWPKVCKEGFTPSAKTGACIKGCPRGYKKVKGKCDYSCAPGFVAKQGGGCKRS